MAFLDFHQPNVVAIRETKTVISLAASELFPETCPYSVYRKDRNLHGGGVMLYPTNAHHRTGKQLGSQFGLRCLQTKLLFMWQVGIGNLMALVKTFSCSEISLTISGTNIKVKKN